VTFLARLAVVSIDRRDLTLGAFMTMVGTFGGWGMRIEFVPDEELHQSSQVEGQRAGRQEGEAVFFAKTQSFVAG
jgi:hypothetical protein